MAKYPLLSFILATVLFGSMTGLNAQTHITAFLSTPGNAGILSESCSGPYFLVIERADFNTESTFITISDLGAAQIGVDYTIPAGSFPLEMAPEDTVAMIPITVIADALPEGLESLAWEIAYLAGVASGVVNVESSIADEYDVEILSATDTIQWCRYAPLQLSASSTAEIHWAPALSFDDSTGSEVTVRPFLSGWYYASVGTENCGAVDSIYLELLIAEIQNPDTVFICNDSSGVILNGRLEGPFSNFKWIPADTTLSNPNILTPLATPTITSTYILQSDLGVCIAADTVVVKVDSLPQDLHIDIAPFKAYYCAGEIVALFSPAYDSLDFPEIEFWWTPDNGTYESDRTLLNTALTLLDTTLYIREVTNNACASKDSILINVVPPAVPISITDTVLCPGEMFTVSILSNQVTEPEWTPTDGLSCTKCLETTVTVTGVPGSTIVYQFSGKVLECPVGASLSIEIPPFQEIIISGDNVLCPGETTQLGVSNPNGLSGYNWSIISGSGTLSCTNCIDPILTPNGPAPVNVLVTANTTNAGFCGAQGLIQVTTSGAVQPIQIAGDNIVCPGDMVPLSIVDATGLSDFNWEVTSGNASLSCTNCPNPIVTTNDTSITVELTANTTNPDFCSAHGEFVFTQGEQVQVDPQGIQACPGSTIVVTTGNPDYINAEWSVINGDLILSCSDCETPTVTVNGAGRLRFFAEINGSDTCQIVGFVDIGIYGGDGGSISIVPLPTDPPTLIQGTTVTAILGVEPQPTNVMWEINGNNISSTDPIIEFNADEEQMFLEATFINSIGCEQTVTYSFVTVPPSYMIPNAFTPGNGDEVNNTFRIIITGNIVVEQFLIFNRWGQKVYDAADSSTDGWDGNWKGENAASDTYVYMATLVYPDGRKQTAKGDVILLR